MQTMHLHVYMYTASQQPLTFSLHSREEASMRGKKFPGLKLGTKILSNSSRTLSVRPISGSITNSRKKDIITKSSNQERVVQYTTSPVHTLYYQLITNIKIELAEEKGIVSSAVYGFTQLCTTSTVWKAFIWAEPTNEELCS